MNTGTEAGRKQSARCAPESSHFEVALKCRRAPLSLVAGPWERRAGGPPRALRGRGGGGVLPRQVQRPGEPARGAATAAASPTGSVVLLLLALAPPSPPSPPSPPLPPPPPPPPCPCSSSLPLPAPPCPYSPSWQALDEAASGTVAAPWATAAERIGCVRLSHAVYNRDVEFERLRDAVLELTEEAAGEATRAS